ncbi:MAG: Ig-like domain-containing protein, partial [Syntrophomonadaceae bacterium]|nr:Ig-like domain-containing protein [Syntrophomonadaceae bacterium]
MKAKRLLSVILCILLNLTLLPMTTQAVSPRDLLKLPESTPGGLTINWYSAIRSYTPTTPIRSNSSRFAMQLDIAGFKTYVDYQVMIDNLSKEKTLEAYNNFDRSVCLGSETLFADSLDADKWVSADNSPQTSDVRDCYVWGEVSGYIKMPRTGLIVVNPSKKYNVDYAVNIFGMNIGRWGTSLGMEIPVAILADRDGNTIHEKDEFIPFTFRVGKMQTDSNNSNEAFSLEIYTADPSFRGQGFTLDEYANLDVRKIGTLIPTECIYSQLSLKDMQRFFVFNPDDYTLTLDTIHKTFPVKDYEYGIVTGDVNDYSVETAIGFQPLQLGVNYVTPDSGTLVIRNKILKTWYISVGTANLDQPRNMAITRRTPTTCTLSWDVPLQKVPDDYKIKYDIYRRETGHNPKFVSTSTMAISNESAQVGSTTDLTFTDKGLKYDSNYEYFVKAAYPTGFSPPSDLVSTDTVAMEEMPSAPTDLKAVPVNQTTSKVDLKLSWSAPQPRKAYRGKGRSSNVTIKEYIIYQKITRRTWGVYFLDPQEIARTTDTSYIDRGFGLSDQCVYYVQSVESTGNRSYSSSPLEVSIQNLIAIAPKIAPNTLMINNGDTVGLVVQYDDSYTGERPGTWSVADSTIVSVEESNTEPITINPKHTIPGTIRAKVTGKKPGATTITFTNTATGISGDCNVTVIPAFKIAPDPLTVYTDETGSLAVTFDAGYKGSRFGSWSVDDNTVATIDQNGVVTGEKAGTAIVTYASGLAPATSAGGNGGVIIETASRVKSAYDIVKTASVVVKPGNFTVNFDPNGGSPKPESVTVRHDTTVARPADPSISDKLFLGWFTAPPGGLMQFGNGISLSNDKKVKKWDFTNDKVTEDMTLYAYWGLRPESSSGSSVHRSLPSWPYITGPDTINLLTVSDSVYQPYTFGGYPAPTYGISDTEPNTANATLTGNMLAIPEGLGVGSYVVTLTATNSEGTVTKTITVNVSLAETLPTITGPDTINLLQGFVSIEQEYTFGGNPEPPTSISAPEPNPANATLTGNMLTIP